MGLFSRRLREVTLDAVLIEAAGERVDVVGESHYLDALVAITGRRDREHIRKPVVAALVREPDNRFDPNAVAIYAVGQKVGHLSREDALAYQPPLVKLGCDRKVLACNALVCGREGTPNLGVFLELPAPDDVLDELNS